MDNSVIVVMPGPMEPIGREIDAFKTIIRVGGLIHNFREHGKIGGVNVNIIAYKKDYARHRALRATIPGAFVWNFDEIDGNIPWEFYGKVKALLGGTKPRQGILALIYAIDIYDKPIYFCGNTLKMSIGDQIYYNEPQSRITKANIKRFRHDMDAERELLENLEKRGAIIRLKDGL